LQSKCRVTQDRLKDDNYKSGCGTGDIKKITVSGDVDWRELVQINL
jgi:hypothetical protein